MKNRSVVRVALFLLLIAGVVSGLSPVFIQASSTNPVITITNASAGDAVNGSGKIYSAVSTINQDLKDLNFWTDDFLTPSYNTANKSCSITVNMTQYKKLENDKQQKTMQVALDGIYNSDI